MRKNKVRRAAFLLPSDRMGGAERVVRTLAECAAKSGGFDLVDVFVLCRSRTGTMDSLENSGLVRLFYTEAKSELGGVWRLAWYLMRNQFSLVFSSSTHINSFVSLLRYMRLLRAERVVARESTVIFERSFGWADALFRGLYRFYGAQDLIVCQTERMRESLDRNTGGRLSGLLLTLPNPVDFSRPIEGRKLVAKFPERPVGKLRVVWCGRLVAIKAPELAIDVLNSLSKRGVPAELILVGDGPERAALESCVALHGLQDQVKFLGYQDNPCLIMAGCDVGLLTSVIEGFPNVVLEMLASGVSNVVSTNCAGGLDGIPGVRVVDSRDAGRLASEISSSAHSNRRGEIDAYLASHSPERFLSCVTGSSGAGVS